MYHPIGGEESKEPTIEVQVGPSSEDLKKIATLEPRLIADDDDGCCATIGHFFCSLWCFITQALALVIIVGVILPILIILLLLGAIYLAIFGWCGSLRRQKVRTGGFKNWLNFYIRNGFKWLWNTIQVLPVIKHMFNDFYTSAVLKGYAGLIDRIPRYNLHSDYTTLDVMYDESRTYYARTLPRDRELTKRLPSLDDATSCFVRPQNGFVQEANNHLSLITAYYAQWFSHQFFNTNPEKPEATNQPVGLNLSQLYGSTPEMIAAIRSFKGGELKSTWINDEEFPPLVPIQKETALLHGKKEFFMPIPLANMVPGFAAVHVLFFRHHQYVARTLAKYYPNLSDDEIFEKTRIILMLTVVKITMEDYVANALQSSHAKIHFSLGLQDRWIYKCFGPKDYAPCNSIQAEFNFLYRWHQFYPDDVRVVKDLGVKDVNSNLTPRDVSIDINKVDCNVLKFPLTEDWNSVQFLTSQKGNMERLLYSASQTHAGKLTLLNTNEWLAKHVIFHGLNKGRKYDMASYNAYRERFGFQRIQNFEDICEDPKIVEKLKSVYKSIDDIEYYVGIWAEEKDFRGIHGPLLAFIGVGFTYSGIFASRVWKSQLVNRKSLTPVGWELLKNITYLQDLTKLHTNLKNVPIHFTVKQ